jgi:hypothetical protein
MMKRKQILKGLGIVIAVLGVGWLWLMWEIGQFRNPDVEFGYYGQFNRVKHVIEDMPNVEILDNWQHHDITLEDFAFTLLIDGGRQVSVTFSENSSQMKMRDKSRIRKFIEEKLEEDSIGIGTLITERPSHTTEHTDHNNGGSAVQGW